MITELNSNRDVERLNEFTWEYFLFENHLHIYPLSMLNTANLKRIVKDSYHD